MTYLKNEQTFSELLELGKKKQCIRKILTLDLNVHFTLMLTFIIWHFSENWKPQLSLMLIFVFH